MLSTQPVPALSSSLLVRNKRSTTTLTLHFVPQSPLTNSAISAIRGQLQSYSDACEALSVVEVTLGFLSTAGGDPGMNLNVYIQDVLQMGDQTALILKVSNSTEPAGISQESLYSGG